MQILTKGDGRRDFDLLGSGDWYGITLDQLSDGREAAWKARLDALAEANSRGIKTWVSFEPVTNDAKFFVELHLIYRIVDRVKIGKLNYHQSDIDWKDFGERAESICKKLGLDYYIKDSLRAEMAKTHG